MRTGLLLAVVGVWLLLRSVNKDSTGRTLVDHLLGNQASTSPLLNAPASSVAAAAGGKGGAVDPFPGATGSRLDQGFDLTGRSFLAPFTGKVVVSHQTDAGWAGGGYLAIQNQANKQQVIYIAEGIAPLVNAGDTVQAGQAVAKPVSNPYNGIVGNIEAGWASPSNPLLPLAKTVSNRPAAATGFYKWLRALGGPTATSTANAGYP